jgi:hypothetical protein
MYLVVACGLTCEDQLYALRVLRRSSTDNVHVHMFVDSFRFILSESACIEHEQQEKNANIKQQRCRCKGIA